MNLKPIEIEHLLLLITHDAEGVFSHRYSSKYIRRSLRLFRKLKAELAYQKEIKKEAKI